MSDELMAGMLLRPLSVTLMWAELLIAWLMELVPWEGK
jgi:hypothetical protein